MSKMDEKNKNIIIAISVALIVLILVAIPTIIVLLQDDGGTNEDPSSDSLGSNGEIDPGEYVDTEETLTGKYVLSVDNGGSAFYTFDGSNRVIHVYTKDNEQITVEYTYVIAKNNLGNKIIKFTEIGTEEMNYHEFYTGTYIDKTPFISINESWYYLQSES